MSLIALAGAGLAPSFAVVGTPTPAQVQGALPQVCTAPPVIKTMRLVTTATTQATNLLRGCTGHDREVLIKLTTKGRHFIPTSIQAEGKTKITSALGTDRDKALLKNKDESLVKVHSPLEIVNIEWQGSSFVFATYSSIIVEHSDFSFHSTDQM